MVTGDHPVTAKAIAKQVGLIGLNRETVHAAGGTGRNRRHEITVTRSKRRFSVVSVDDPTRQPDDPLEVITGDRIAGLTEDDWTTIIRKKYVVFARTTPEHKLFIVEQCRKRRE